MSKENQASGDAGVVNESGDNDPWTIVDNFEKCHDVATKLRRHCNEYNVLGIGVDRPNRQKQKNKLLLIATHGGFCALIRLHSLNQIPDKLREILEDENIIKVGVGICDDAVKLTNYNVRVESILDLRYLARKYKPDISESIHLGHLSKEYLEVDLREAKRLQSIHWKKKTADLDERNIEYAAKTVGVAIRLFKRFQELENSMPTNCVQTFIEDHCKPYLNKIYKVTKEKTVGNQPVEFVGQESDLLRNQDPHIINNVEHCRAVVEKLRDHCSEYNVMGFGCKCSKAAKTVTLLQLVTHRGLCALIQLRKLTIIPLELKELLEDKNILKVGDNASSNAKRMEGDYGIKVANAVDLTKLAKQCEYPSSNLNQLSKTLLNVDFRSLDWRLLNTELKSENISLQEIKYVADTVHVMIELFKLFERKLVAEKYLGDRDKFINDLCSKEDLGYFTPANQEIKVVNTAEEYKDIAEELQLHCSEYNVLGFDCESKSPGGEKVALLQLATHRGLCVLIRLCKLQTIPSELRTIMADESILKVGIMPHTDAYKLNKDYKLQVGGTLDLKSLAKKCRYKAKGIGSLCEEVLKVKLTHKIKGLTAQHIHQKWQNDTLNQENIKYAADDAHVAIELFKNFKEKLMRKNHTDDQTQDLQRFIDKHCKSHLKIPKKKPTKNKSILLADIEPEDDIIDQIFDYIEDELPDVDMDHYSLHMLVRKDQNFMKLKRISVRLDCTEALYKELRSPKFWESANVVVRDFKKPSRKKRIRGSVTESHKLL